MLRRLLAFFVLCALVLSAQQKMSVAQLKSVLRSSIRLNHSDRQVAEYIRKIQLTERLTHRDVEELLGEGLGVRAADELRKLVAATASLPPPVKDPAPVKPVPIPPPSSVEQARVISEAREMALSYTKRLPDFICLQVTRRYVDPSGLEMFQLMDTVAERLSYFEQKEEYKLISINGKWTDGDRWKLGGATSSGEFGTMLKEIFDPATEADFQWERWGKLRGRVCHVYSFRVRQAKSKWHISWQRQLEIVPGYRGLIYIDRDVPMVLRVTMEAVDIPPTFPIQEARTMLDYDFVDIAGNEFLLPLRSEMRMREGRLLVKNNVEFRSYRKFGAEAIITFDPNLEPIPDEQLREEKVEPPAAGGVKPPQR
ncbi:MAG: hypothetical protein KatS3mg005_3480 [Bryobacteraceae bacterium]|nr:MAG: hypothetical protein KatS3mg005_3480 [Bryobacteraceae bacterium]